MNTKDIRTSTDPDLAGSYAAMERAARAAQDLAIKTNTGTPALSHKGRGRKSVRPPCWQPLLMTIHRLKSVVFDEFVAL